WGGVELHFDIERGNVIRSQIYTDSLDPAPLETLSEMLVGQRYTPESLKGLIGQLIQRYPNNKIELNELQEWLVTAIA
ncbi:lipoate protein ligase C-terminal domain-containing protein, partial [Proteus terrae]